MIEKFFAQPKVLTRLRAGILGPHLPAVASSLHRAGYSVASIRRHVRAADHFGSWLGKQGISVAKVNLAVVERYVQGLGRRCSASRPQGRLPHSALGLRGLVDVLREQDVLGPMVVDNHPLSSIQKWLTEFDRHLDSVVGCAAGSRKNYVRYAGRLLEGRVGKAEIDWSMLSAVYVTAFVRQEAAKLQPSSCGQSVTAIRAFLRFLASRGLVADGLQGAVPPVITWRHSSLPRTLSAEEVERVIAACDSGSIYGLRERAIVLLLARLGLRAGEVIGLRLDDIDWVHGCILIRAGKTHRERSLPLSDEVGDALVKYLREARPPTSHREMFLRWHPPFRRLRSSVSICTLTQKLLKRAGISVHRPGAHVLRHSLATGMVVRGATFKAAADVLGHQSLATTGIYAKLDLEALSRVAMPWPGGAQ
jgi:site-specific recombinase XerD